MILIAMENEILLPEQAQTRIVTDLHHEKREAKKLTPQEMRKDGRRVGK